MKHRLVTLAAAASLLLFGSALTARAGSPPTTSPNSEDSIRGTVLGIDGKPLARARVLLVRPGEHTWISAGAPTKGVRSRYASKETAADGTFTFSRDERDATAYWLVVLSNEGCADLLFTEESDDEVEAAEPAQAEEHERAPQGHTLQLRRWGRINGILRRGNAPLANETVSYSRLSSLGMQVAEPPGVYFNDYATTGADGTFTFDRVPPGVNQVCQTIARQRGSTRSHLTPVTVEPGTTAKVTVGGTGRPVVGKFDVEEPLDWSHVDARLVHEPVPEGGFRGAQEVLEAFIARREYYITVDVDGSFRAEDVPPGQYQLRVSMLHVSIPKRAETTFGIQPEQIEVPPMDGDRSDEPLEVGVVLVEPRN